MPLKRFVDVLGGLEAARQWPQPALIFDADRRRTPYAIDDAYCVDLACAGREAFIRLVPSDPASAPVGPFWLHLDKGRPSFQDGEPTPEWRAIALELADHAPTRTILVRHCQIVRASALAEATDVPLPGTAALWRFDDFDPRGDPYAIPFDVGGQPWEALDQYCGNPDCPCCEASLAFYRIDDDDGEPRDPDLELRLELPSGASRAENGRPLTPEHHSVLEAFKASLGSWAGELLARRELLHRIVRRHLIPTAPIARGAKVGRNDPCPCGSGRKYKRCCGQAA